MGSDTRLGSGPALGHACHSISDEVRRYLQTGESDPLYRAWPGSGIVERANRAHDDLRGSLVRVVRQRTSGLMHRPSLEIPRQNTALAPLASLYPNKVPHVDLLSFTRAKVESMVRGLFPRAEQEVVLLALAHSVVFLTSDNIEALLLGPGFDSAAWDLANLYLGSLGAELLSDQAPALVGLSQETTCYVSCEYFTEEDPFADFVVHEVAHTFHNVKRASLSLPSGRSKEWLLDIDYRNRETFASSCEAFSRIIDRAKTVAERRTLAKQYGDKTRVFDERADSSEVASIVQEAAGVRNGWKVILSRCAPPRRRAQS